MSKVETINVRPPVPSTAFDWQAHFPDDEGSDMVGYGATEADALRDLCEQMRESRDFWRDQFNNIVEG